MLAGLSLVGVQIKWVSVADHGFAEQQANRVFITTYEILIMKKILLVIGTAVVVLSGNTSFASDGSEAAQRFNARDKPSFQQQQDNKAKTEKAAELARQASEKEARSTAQREAGALRNNEKTN